MRVAIDARMIRVTGIGRYITQLARALHLAGLDITLLLSGADQKWFEKNMPNIKTLLTPEPIYSWSEQLLLPARLKREEFDLVHFTNFNLPVSYKRPYVLTIHDLTPLSFGGERRRGWVSQQAYRHVINSGLSRAKQVMVPTRRVKNELPPRYRRKVSIVPYALGDIFRCASVIDRALLNRYAINSPYVLYVGNYRTHKNIPTLVQAFASFSKSNPASQLVLVGDIDKHKRMALFSLACQYRLEKKLIITGQLHEKELLAIYDQAKLFVLPSFKEGFGFVALEAAARGVPTIVSESTPVREFLGRGVLSFEPTNVKQLADLMSVVWRDKVLASGIAKYATQLAVKRNWRNVANNVIEIYKNAYHQKKAIK